MEAMVMVEVVPVEPSVTGTHVRSCRHVNVGVAEARVHAEEQVEVRVVDVGRVSERKRMR
jgi:hypothetical protein